MSPFVFRIAAPFLAAAMLAPAARAQSAPAPAPGSEGRPPRPPPPVLFPVKKPGAPQSIPAVPLNPARTLPAAQIAAPAVPVAPAAPAESLFAPAPAAPAPPAVPAPEPPAAVAGPWKVLFNGTSVTGLRGLQKSDFLKAGWKIENGALTLVKAARDSGKQTGGDLITTDAYTDFEFSFEWKMEVAGDGGVMYLPRAATGQKPTGHEFQLIDDVRNPDGLKGGKIKRTGSLYSVLEPGDNKTLKDGDWNQGSLVIEGNHVEHWINGQKVLAYDLGSPDFKKALVESKFKTPMGFGQKFKAPVVLLDQGEDIAFRNLRIRQIGPK